MKIRNIIIINTMVKEIFHILKTYIITFQYINKKNYINIITVIILFFIFFMFFNLNLIIFNILYF